MPASFPPGEAPGRRWVVGIDLSAPGGQVALLDAAAGEDPAPGAAASPRTGGALQLQTLPERPRNAVTLLPALEGMRRRAGASSEAIAAVGVAIGPGSFTGLRIGLATAKGLAMGWDRPLYAVPSLEALAAEALARDRRAGASPPAEWVVAFRDARHGELFTATFAAGAAFAAGEEALVAAGALSLPPEGTVLLAGAAPPPSLAGRIPSPRLRHIALSTAAGAVARLALRAWRAGLPPAPPGLAPRYGRRPQAQTQWPRPET